MDSFEQMRRLPIFRAVPESALRLAAEVVTSADVGPGEVLTVEGEEDTSLMVVFEGELEVVKGDPPVRLATVGRGEIVGDMALFGEHRVRTATVRTTRDSTLLVIDETGIAALRAAHNPTLALLEAAALRAMGRRLREMDDLISRMAQGTVLASSEPEGLFAWLKSLFVPPDPNPKGPPPSAVAALQLCGVFARCPEEEVNALAMELEMIPAPEGALVIQEGQLGGDAYIVAEGSIEVYRATSGELHEKVATLGPGSLFGIVSLVHGSTRSATCFVRTPSWLLRIPSTLYRELEGADIPEARALRKAVYEALRGHLEQANSHVADLARSLAADPNISERDRASFKAMVVGTA